MLLDGSVKEFTLAQGTSAKEEKHTGQGKNRGINRNTVLAENDNKRTKQLQRGLGFRVQRVPTNQPTLHRTAEQTTSEG